MASSQHFTAEDYTVALICSMPVEQATVTALLDEDHRDLRTTTLGVYSYTYGRIHKHNIVIAAPLIPGKTSTASVAMQVHNDFRNLQFGLLIGIGGGVPDIEHGFDIRLGDVVVSKPEESFGGLVQFSRGKAPAGGKFERTGSLNSPPHAILATVGGLEGVHRQVDSEILTFLEAILQRYPITKAGGYVYQGAENDQLFRAEVEHDAFNRTCDGCETAGLVQRTPRTSLLPVIHYGTIGSSDAVIKDGLLRDKIRDDLGICCIETEAAGLMESFPCLVIRGISDYADSHKNDRWQPYAAAAAAAYAKVLLSCIPVLNRPQDNRSHRGETVFCVGNARNLLSGSAHEDVVGGDKVLGNRVSGSRVWSNGTNKYDHQFWYTGI
ncbi:purine and uridine phosphorylase [Aspergillus pseudodeflectus]|uniref:Purine and uridine phosphorylase n=1 Tax=Aspergillus pseudodeflectus TaxID=176178 RepID=A0ABR4L3G0_9EURO